MEFINKPFSDLLSIAEKEKKAYARNPPFPNTSFKDFFNADMLEGVLSEFPDLSKGDSLKMNNAGQVKLAAKGERRFGPKTKDFVHFLNSEPMLEFLQELTGIKEKLIPDPYFDGGGMHEIKRGGFLKLHADFNKHPSFKLDRRINVLIYLNKDWKEEYGGHFELWDADMKACVKKIAPYFNTLAIFSTTDFSYHGHPDPLNCPANMSRKSLALYYYSNGRPAEEIRSGDDAHSTLFVGRPGHNEENINEKKFRLKNLFKFK